MKRIILFVIMFLSLTFAKSQFIETKKPDIEKIHTGLSYGWAIYKHTSYDPTTIKYVYEFRDMKYQILHINYQLWFDNFQEFKDFVIALNRCVVNKEIQLSNKETSTGFKYSLSYFSNMGSKNVKILLYTDNGIKEGWIQKTDILYLNDIVGYIP